jgi:hypothetical protein
MSTINDGGPAFPFDGYGERVSGMTLRDWFAGQALAGVTSSVNDEISVGQVEGIAEIAYALADAMLAAREVKP